MNNDAKVRPWSGRLLWRVLFVGALVPSIAGAQSSPTNGVAKKASVRRANELVLAGLRPGNDKIARARALYGSSNDKASKFFAADAWEFVYSQYRTIYLVVSADKQGTIQTIRVVESHPDAVGLPLQFSKIPSRKLASGLGISVGDSCSSVEKLYGAPDSRSPSTRDHQPLELWYYAFDWAGENVPQVMEVLCTRETDGKPGQVVEITLAAPSL